MSGTSLKERYIWTVVRHLPEDTKPDVARELRGTLDEVIEGRIATGESPADAEYGALADLGDPDVLAREYAGRPHHLIGPDMYPDYVRLLKVLFLVVAPLAPLANFVVTMATSDESVLEALGGAALLFMQVVIHLGFWTTLVFALIERYRPEAEQGHPVSSWTPTMLREVDVPWHRASFTEMAFDVAFGVAFTALVVWQFTGVGDPALQVLDPDLTLGWQAAAVGVLVLDVVVTVLAWRVGRWTPGVAAVNVAVNLAAAGVWLWLLLTDRLLTDLPSVLAERFGTEAADWSAAVPVVAAGIIIVFGWDAIASLVRAWRTSRAESARDTQAYGS